MLTELLILIIIGLMAGTLGGLLGIGGSVIIIPGLLLVFGPAQHKYQGAAMIVNFFVAFPAAVQHYRAGAILRPIVRDMIPAATISVLAGVWLSAGPWFRGEDEIYLSRLFGGFLLYVVVYNMNRLRRSRPLPDIDEDAASKKGHWKNILGVGVPMGLAGGLLGIGGGALAVPLQQVFLRMPLRRAIANSATTIVPLSFLGAIYKNYSNTQMGIPFREALSLALPLIPAAIVGAILGARLTHAIPRRALRVALIVLLAYAGIELLRRPWPEDSDSQQQKKATTDTAVIDKSPLNHMDL